MSYLAMQARGVSKAYRTGGSRVEALRAIDLDVEAGEFLAVMGPSGSGKTTLLNCLAGLDEVDEGDITIAGQSLGGLSDDRIAALRAEHMGFVFQASNLLGVFSAVENVELPLLLARRPRSEARSRATETLERVGLGGRLGHRPSELSGGEQQRVAVARALAGSPSVVWADEPTGSLDSQTALVIMDLLRSLNDEGMTIVMVTHDAVLARYASRLVMMRDGEIVEDRAPQQRRRRRAAARADAN
jgi:putative ABC transport system ATP-binding protein